MSYNENYFFLPVKNIYGNILKTNKKKKIKLSKGALSLLYIKRGFFFKHLEFQKYQYIENHINEKSTKVTKLAHNIIIKYFCLL